MQIQDLNAAKRRRRCIIVLAVRIAMHVRKHSIGYRLNLIIRSNEPRQIHNFIPLNIRVLVEVVVVHLEHLLGNVLQAHGGNVESAIRSGGVYPSAYE